MLIITALSTLLFSVLIVYQVLGWLTGRKQTEIGSFETNINRLAKDQSAQENARWLNRQLRSKSGSSLRRRYLDKVKASLLKTGIHLTPESFVVISLFLAFSMALSSFVLSEQLIVTLIFAFLGFLGPWSWLKVVRRRRAQRIEGQLLTAIILINNSLRVGYSFTQALELVAEETPHPLGLEFKKVVQETKMGTPLEEALNYLIHRVDSEDLEMMVTAIVIQSEVGGNLAEVLDSVATSIDNRIKSRVRLKAVTAQAKLSSWLVSITPFALGAFVFGVYPDYGRIMLTEPLGLAMLGIGFVLYLSGVLIIRRVANVEL